jgi:5-methylcytosine-specific restriction endonuclease McrA
MGPRRDELVKSYEGGASYQEIADEYGVTRTTVMRWFKHHGIAPRSRADARVIAAKKYPASEKQREAARQRAAAMRAARGPDTYEKMVATRKENGVNYHYGPDNHRWRGGITPLYARRSWAVRARECWDRDGWVCQDCGCECYGRRVALKVDPRRCVQAHHIVPRRNGGSNELENLVTLCLSCHRVREAAGINALFA